MSNIYENKGALASTILVAASDSLNKAAANYVCSGAADDVEIQAALNAASAVAGGGEVCLLEGNYVTSENIVVPDDCTLRGMGFDTIITPTGPNIGGAANGAIELGNRCSLKDMKVILIAGAGQANLRPNVVMADTKTQTRVENCWLMGDGSVADDASNSRQNNVLFNTVTDSSVLNCRIGDSKRQGITLIVSTDNAIIGNSVQSGVAPWSGIGIYLRDDSDRNRIVGNICTGTYGYGVSLDHADANTITGNLCRNNYDHGIRLGVSCNNTITGNTCYDNAWDGIEIVSNSYRNTIVGNTISENGLYGIYVHNYSHWNTITGNTVYANGTGGTKYPGIYVWVSGANVITGNQCDGNGLHGIHLLQASYCTISGNVCINQQTGDGIIVEGDATTNSDYNSVTGNVCYNNGDDGIEIAGGADANKNVVAGNQLLGNAGTPLVDGGTNTDIGHNITV